MSSKNEDENGAISSRVSNVVHITSSVRDVEVDPSSYVIQPSSSMREVDASDRLSRGSLKQDFSNARKSIKKMTRFLLPHGHYADIESDVLSKKERYFELFRYLYRKGIFKGPKNILSYDRHSIYLKSKLLLFLFFLLMIILGIILVCGYKLANTMIVKDDPYRIQGTYKPFKIRGCVDKRFSDFQTACKDASNQFFELEQLNDIGRKYIAYFHNKRRSMEYSSNMNYIYYDYYLEQSATKHAAQCTIYSDEKFQRWEPYYKYAVGQIVRDISNLTRLPDYMRTLAGDSLDGFFWEQKNHTLQFYVAEVTRIGCGIAKCESLKIIVCNYYRGENEMNEIPFLKGPVCSKCHNEVYCRGNLCDCGDVEDCSPDHDF
ncbi:hypothetical protein SNEBB_005440 [Seison nebaliae]|nr:hypothetical protein SNEBB_005440 [Seison nebaliae]